MKVLLFLVFSTLFCYSQDNQQDRLNDLLYKTSKVRFDIDQEFYTTLIEIIQYNNDELLKKIEVLQDSIVSYSFELKNLQFQNNIQSERIKELLSKSDINDKKFNTILSKFNGQHRVKKSND